MKWITALSLLFSSYFAFSQDTLYCKLPANYYRQYVLHEDSTFTFSYRLQQGPGYSKGTWSKKGDDYFFQFDKEYTPHNVQYTREDVHEDSLIIRSSTKHEMFVNVDSAIYRGYRELKVPRPKYGEVIFQVNSEVVWLRELDKGNVIDIEIVTQGDNYYMSNLDWAQLKEYRNNFFEIKQNHMFFAAKRRDISHRMKKVDYIRKK